MVVIEATSSVVRLVIPGAPVGKGRPRFGKGRTYTDKATILAEKDVRAVWREGGSHRLPDGPVVAHIHICCERPQSHFTSKGALSATGRRSPFPVRKPDLDNAAKLLLDSLNGLAYRDDSQVVELHVRRRWTDHEREIGEWTVLTLLTKTLGDVEQDELNYGDWE
jgi:Holliday junction resolvase RusA-like endonuclease